jgi:hypothetical protein
MRRSLVIVSMLVVLILATFTGSAAAGPNPTPAGWVGACNMSVSWPTLSPGNAVGIGGTVEFDGDGGGMENAMTVDNPNGNDGMFNASVVSGGQIC